MNRLVLLGGALAGLLVMAALAVPMLRQLDRETRLATRLRALREGSVATPRGGGSATRMIAGIGTIIAGSGVLSRTTIEGLQQTLSVAGLRGSGALGLFVGAKLLLLIGLPVATFLILPHFGVSSLVRNISIAGAAVVGLLAPDWWVGRQHARYVKAVAGGLADALDMMVICAEAGLGFESALARVGSEIRHAHPEVGAELSQTITEMRLAADSRQALANMGMRTGLASLKRVGAILAQTLQYGTPLGQALRVLSAEMRFETMVRFEARAARLPVLLTLPMIVFILPCIFLIVGGPAAIQAMRSMHH